MPIHTEDRTQHRIEKLKREIARLEAPKVQTRPHYRKVAVNMRLGRKRDTNRLSDRIMLNGGIQMTTRAGSLYTTIVRVLAEHGQLDRQAQLFTKFLNNISPKSARTLIEQISVRRDFLEERVRTNGEYLEHCDKRTCEYRRKAAAGIKKYQRIIRNRKIFVGGRWVGDIQEAINILYVGRKPDQVLRSKNVQILNRAKLMFDVLTINGEERIVLYMRKWHAAFKRACALLAK